MRRAGLRERKDECFGISLHGAQVLDRGGKCQAGGYILLEEVLPFRTNDRCAHA